MGITINRQHETGYVVNYVRILSSPSIRMDTNSAEVYFAVYKDFASRFDGKAPIDPPLRVNFKMAQATRDKIAKALYEDPTVLAAFTDGTPRDPDPEREETE